MRNLKKIGLNILSGVTFSKSINKLLRFSYAIINNWNTHD